VVLGPHSPHAALSARQLEVAKLIAGGVSTREIAERLALSTRTVETHIATIFEKLGVHTRAQLTAALSAADASAPAGGETQTGSIPRNPQPLIGREADISAVAALVASNRVVTIVGTGGLGKTQTAIRVAAHSVEAYRDGVWFVDFASLASGDFIPMEIAQGLKLSLPMGDEARDALAARLQNKSALLVLDNCEHLIGPMAAVVAKLVRACPRIAILSTSREPLGITGEATYRLPPLEIAHAAALFVARAKAIDNHFTIDGEGSRAIAEICRRLDGIPLAIELAASRSTMFSPNQLLKRLEGRFALLDGGLRDALPRHKSMRSLIDWSYEQLADGEQSLFRRLSVFTGKFSLEAAHAVSGLSNDREFELIGLLSSLIDKSLVSLERENETTAYRLLESMRDYTRLKSDENAETDCVARLYTRYLRDALIAIGEKMAFTTSAQAMFFFRNHLGDIRWSLDWALRSGEIVTGAELLLATEFLWSSRSIREGITRIEAYLAALGDDRAVIRSRLLAHLTELRWRAGEQDRAIETAAQSLRLARASGDDAALAWALIAEATVVIFKDPARTLALLTELEALPTLGEATRREGRQLRARLTYMNGDFERAAALYADLIDRDRRTGNPMGEAQNTWILANLEYKAGRPEKAVEIGRSARALLEPLDDFWAIALVTRGLAGFLVAIEAYDEAERVAADALALYRDIDPGNAHIGTLVEILALIVAERGAFARAAMLQGFALTATGKSGGAVCRSSTLAVHERLDRRLAGALGAEELADLRARGARLSAEDATSLAMAKDGLAG
jgi:predicted ATPase/DNA-binding CsgD family transcriptional regulator